MRVAVIGCLHGMLDKMYEDILAVCTPDLILCCGDFQAAREEQCDLHCMSVPAKFLQMADFHGYYRGDKKAPVLTIFIGGNHEASNHMRELFYGGWVAENMYYLGQAGVIDIETIVGETSQVHRVAGVSGIEGKWDYRRGLFESMPLNSESIKSIFHYREFDIERFKLFHKMSKDRKVDIVMSHEWPTMVTHEGYANEEQLEDLLRKKKFFKQDIEKGQLGARCLNTICWTLRPHHWFSGHLHVKYQSRLKLQHTEDPQPDYVQFLALDKPEKGKDWREYFDILDICGDKIKSVKKFPEPRDKCVVKLKHSAEWLKACQLAQKVMPLQKDPVDGLRQRFAELEIAADLPEFDNLEIKFDADQFKNEQNRLQKYLSGEECIVNLQTQQISEKFGLDIEFLKGTSENPQEIKGGQRVYPLVDSGRSFKPFQKRGQDQRHDEKGNFRGGFGNKRQRFEKKSHFKGQLNFAEHQQIVNPEPKEPAVSAQQQMQVDIEAIKEKARLKKIELAFKAQLAKKDEKTDQ